MKKAFNLLQQAEGFKRETANAGRTMRKLLLLLGRAYFNFLNHSGSRMLFSILLGSEATSDSASRYLDCFCHS